ncbi:MAG: hypothetical protein GXN93_04795 [Candidatus Diapherotrites archaeon]|nr:hypothetical protein [Candidatus Diapherotrites archaeon]
MQVVVTRLTSRKAYSLPDAALLTLIAMAVSLFAALLVVPVASLLFGGILPTALTDMTFDGFLQYVAGFAAVGLAFATVFDLATDAKFAKDHDIAEVVFGAFLGPIVGVILVKLGMISSAVLVGNLWMWPALALTYFLMKVIIGR